MTPPTPTGCTPVAVFDAKVAASNMLNGTTSTPDYTGISTAVCTISEFVLVGLLEVEANDQAMDVEIRYSDISRWRCSRRAGEFPAAAKVLIDRARDQVVGVSLLRPEYTEIANTLGWRSSWE